MITKNQREWNLAEELLYQDNEIAARTVMAKDGDCHDDLKAIFCEHVACPIQTHSLNVGIVDSECIQNFNQLNFEDTDALITFKRKIPVGVVTADCVPILIYAPDIKAIGAIHAGWKGTLGGIVDNVSRLLMGRGADLFKLKVIFGPSISQKMYEVDDNLAEKFREAGFNKFILKMNKPHVDLQGINVERFIKNGVDQCNIIMHNGCSYSSRYDNGDFKYQSYRRGKGEAGRMLTYITFK